MALIRIIVRVQRDSLDQTANTKSTNVIRDHAKMVEHALITITITRAIVLTDLRAKIVLSMSIGVHRIHAKMVRHACNVKIHSNVIACRDGLENCATSKWFHAKMRRSVRGSM